MREGLIERIIMLCQRLNEEGFPTTSTLRNHRNQIVIVIQLKEGDALQLRKRWDKLRVIEGG